MLTVGNKATAASADCNVFNYGSTCYPVSEGRISLVWEKKEEKKKGFSIISNYLVTEMEFSVPAKMSPIQCDATGDGIPAAASAHIWEQLEA